MPAQMAVEAARVPKFGERAVLSLKRTTASVGAAEGFCVDGLTEGLCVVGGVGLSDGLRDGDLLGLADAGEAVGAAMGTVQTQMIGSVRSQAVRAEGGVVAPTQAVGVSVLTVCVPCAGAAVDVQAAQLSAGEYVPPVVQPDHELAAVVTPAVSIEASSVAPNRLVQLVAMWISVGPKTSTVGEKPYVVGRAETSSVAE